jgi:hypothetical protein
LKAFTGGLGAQKFLTTIIAGLQIAISGLGEVRLQKSRESRSDERIAA